MSCENRVIRLPAETPEHAMSCKNPVIRLPAETPPSLWCLAPE